MTQPATMPAPINTADLSYEYNSFLVGFVISNKVDERKLECKFQCNANGKYVLTHDFFENASLHDFTDSNDIITMVNWLRSKPEISDLERKYTRIAHNVAAYYKFDQLLTKYGEVPFEEIERIYQLTRPDDTKPSATPFKAGDSVYCLYLGGGIYDINVHDKEPRCLVVGDGNACEMNECHTNLCDAFSNGIQMVYLATPENYKILSTSFPHMRFEPPLMWLLNNTFNAIKNKVNNEKWLADLDWKMDKDALNELLLMKLDMSKNTDKALYTILMGGY